MENGQRENYLSSLKMFLSKHGFTDEEVVEVARQEQLELEDPCIYNYVMLNRDLSSSQGSIRKKNKTVKQGISITERRQLRSDSNMVQKKAAGIKT